MGKSVNVGVVGATGYAGGELLRLFASHDGVRLVAATSDRATGDHVTSYYPNLRGLLDLQFVAPSLDALADCDVVFFATPHGVAMNMAPDLLQAGKRVIDLSADFRLRDRELWARWYGQPHAAPELLAEAVYGMPEIDRRGFETARLIAAPGCYPTAVVLGLKPLLAAGLIDPSDLIADAKTGASGAGRTSNPAFGYAEVAESMRAYGVAGHRHVPEIEQTLMAVAGGHIDLTFVPHLVPMVRGMEATLYARLTEAGDPQAVLEAAYVNEPFVDVMPAGQQPATGQVRATNNVGLSVTTTGSNRVIVVSVIDNLLKGAAGQAVQSFNLMVGFPETTGLVTAAAFP